MKRPPHLVVVALLVALTPAPAPAGVPSSWSSTVDPRLVLCPGGDVPFHVLVRRANTPVAGAQVTLNFYRATGWALCAIGQPAAITIFDGGDMATVTADGTGTGTLWLKAGGTTADSTVQVLGDGVLLGNRFLASVDQNGDLEVDAADEAILVSKLGTHDLSADFDGDGVVTEADRAILRQHLGHTCALATPARSSTWGALKSAYR